MLGKTDRSCFVAFFSLMLACTVAGCAQPNLYATAPAPYAAAPIAPDHGRLVFGKGLVQKAHHGFFPSGLSYLAEENPLFLFEIVGTNMIPVAEFTLVPNKNSLVSDEIYYVDIPAGTHRFMANRYQQTQDKDSLYGRGNVFAVDVKAGETVPLFIVPDTEVTATRIAIEKSPPMLLCAPAYVPTAKGRQKRLVPQYYPGSVQEFYQYPFQPRSYSLHQEDVCYSYALRAKNISDMERAELARQKAAEHFASEEASFPLKMALTAVAVMKPAKPSDTFRNWTADHQEDLLKRWQLASPAPGEQKTFDIYGEPPLRPAAGLGEGNSQKTDDSP